MNPARFFRVAPLIGLCVLAACGQADRTADPAGELAGVDCRPFYYHDDPFHPAPGDFRAAYGFLTGTSMGPVDSYAYHIVINRDIGDTIYMELGVYNVEADPVTRAEPFDVSLEEVNDLYGLMLEQDVFREYWELLPPDEWPCGAAGRSLEVQAGGQSYLVNGFIVDEGAVTPVYWRMVELVPDAIWEDLWAWRDEYVAVRP